MRGTPSSLAVRRRSRPLAFRVIPTEVRHGQGVYDTVRLAHKIPLTYHCGSCNTPRQVARQLERFPEGQFVAVTEVDGEERVIGAATLMRTSRSPTLPPLSWHAMTGGLELANHEPEGWWLYGVEMAVRPEYQGRGVASALYKARFGLVAKLGLKGFYCGGMLKGYHRYKETLSVLEYYDAVIQGDLFDPTVSKQLKKGFKPLGLIRDYVWDCEAGDAAALLVWEPKRNPEVVKPHVARPATQGTRV